MPKNTQYLTTSSYLDSHVYLNASASSASTDLRLPMIAALSVCIVLSVFVSVFLPTRVHENLNSPASLLLILLLWFVDGTLVFVGLLALLGATFTSPPSEQ